jgi:hypothetical protein
MTPQKIVAGSRPASSLAAEVDALARDGQDVVVIFGDGVRPERIVKVLAASAAGHDVKLVIRHAEFREYIENAVLGATAGAAIGAGAAVLVAITAGAPIALPTVLAAAGVGAVIGMTLMGGGTPIAEVRVYRSRGQTCVKFLAAA